MIDDKSIELSDKQLRKLQLELLDLLLEFDRVCRKTNIRYFISSGTLLGAVRHKGFIPWDDDADVEMLREDYEKFKKICDDVIDHGNFFFQDNSNDPNYRWCYGKMRKQNTEYIRIGQSHLRQRTGLCIDVFPLDDVPNSNLGQRFFEKACGLCRKISWSEVGKKVSHSYIEKLIYSIMSLIPIKFVLKLNYIIATAMNSKGKKFIASYNVDSRSKYGFALPKRCYEDTVTLEFEGEKFPAPIGYDEILHIKYGDYLMLPKEENRHGGSTACRITFSDGESLSTIKNKGNIQS